MNTELIDEQLDEKDFKAMVRWHPEDLLLDYPHIFKTYEEALKWLDENESHIQQAMTSAGSDAIAALVPFGVDEEDN